MTFKNAVIVLVLIHIAYLGFATVKTVQNIDKGLIQFEGVKK